MARVRQYADDEAPEETPADAAPPEDESSEGAGGAGQGEPGQVDEDMPPDGHDQWRRHFEYACKYDPTLYGLVRQYADAMAGEAQQEDPAGDPNGDPNADPGADPNADPGADPVAEGDPGDEQAPSPEEVADLLAEGAGPMPEPEGDGGQPPQEQYGLVKGAAGALGGGVAGGMLGTGVGALVGKPEVGGDIGAGLGAAAGGYKGLTMQNNEAPVNYQAELAQLKKRQAAFEQALRAKDQEVAQLKAVNARREGEMLVYQLAQEGYVADRAAYDGLVEYMAAVDPAGRDAKAKEIRSYWRKDESAAYAAQGAPVGDFVSATDRKVEGGAPAKFGDAQLDAALAYLRRNPGKSWEECQQYAMNGGVVN
jgi:hypothetical protein